MTLRRTFIAGAAACALSGAALAQTSTMPQPATGATGRDAETTSGAGMAGDTRRVRITYENTTTGQGFAPSVFMSHDASAMPLYKEGEKASFGLQRLAEEGNIGPLLAEAVWKVGDLVVSGVEPEGADGGLCRGCRPRAGQPLPRSA